MDINGEIIDALLDRPIGFTIGEEQLYLYPVTLGKSFLIARYFSTLKINDAYIKTKPDLEALRLVKEYKDTVLTIIAYHTTNSKAQIFDAPFIDKRKKLIAELDDADIATLFINTLTEDKYNIFIHKLGIDRERAFFNKAIKVKKDSSLSFFGKSIYGTLISAACEKYGWTLDYVVWGISYINLRLLLADAPQTVYLSDDERKKVHIPQDREVINASDPKNAERIKEIIGEFN